MPGLKDLRKYGYPPYHIAVIHGGPGAAGSMAPVARELSRTFGILEPLQTASSVDGQVAELHDVLEKHASLPVMLLGHSWGAWLSIILAARYPSFVKKLILVGSGPLEEKYASKIAEIRESRLSREDKLQLRVLEGTLNDPGIADRDEVFALFGKLMEKADTFDMLPEADDREKIVYREDINLSVWSEAVQLRRSGELLNLAKKIQCPVLAIHGDYDPHPAEGVEKPLGQAITGFRLILLKGCGHEPWKERLARDRFYSVLKEELHRLSF